MNLLGILKYYKNNMRRFVSVVAAISLSVLLVYMFQMVMDSITVATNDTLVEPRRYFSIVRQKEVNPDPILINRLKERQDVEQVLPFVYWTTGLKLIIGGAIPSDILQVREKGMDLLMSKMGMHVIEGRKPLPGSHEILLHELVAVNKKLKIGDQFGSLNDKNEWLSGSYQIVGIVTGKPVVSFTSYETAFLDFNMNNEYQFGALILPKKGGLDSLNVYLDALPNYYDVITYNTCIKAMDNNISNIDLLTTVISLLVMIIVSVCVGFLCYIYFTQRRSEFGLLWAIGYSRQQVVNRVFVEIGGMNLVGFAAGAAASVFIGWILKVTVYAPAGAPLDLFSLNCILKAFCVALFATLFSIIPIWRMLGKLDPVSIIEGVM